MTVAHLYAILSAEMSAGHANKEVKIWLPGSKISLVGAGATAIRQGDLIMVEGNLDQGSALS